MRTLLAETESNFRAYTTRWQAGLSEVSAKLDANGHNYLASYRRIISLQAWRIYLEPAISADSLAFFAEAQNDALSSHVFGRLGSWRVALKCLRSCAENVLFCLYYKDHPIELELWASHKHRLSFADTITYFRKHPLTSSMPDAVTGLATLQKEYTILSAAVHASASKFRMTVDGQMPMLWNSNKSSLGAWSTREGHVLVAINLLLLSLFRDDLKGAKLPNLRKAISLVLGQDRHRGIRSDLGVRLFSGSADSV